MSEHLMVLRPEYLNELFLSVKSADGCKRYAKSEPFPLESAKLQKSSIKVNDAFPELKMENGNRAVQDADNAVLIHKYVGNLSGLQASDSRLWAYLTHGPFWAYTQHRWPDVSKKVGDGTAKDYVRDHWFTKGGKAGLRRNAISRLWWAARLTHAPWVEDESLKCLQHADPYRYTRILLSNQDIYQGLMERDFGGNLRLRISTLSTFDKFKDVSDVSAFVNRFFIQLNLLSSYRELSALNVEVLLETLLGIAERVKKGDSKDQPVLVTGWEVTSTGSGAS